jgi:hypothetical protein
MDKIVKSLLDKSTEGFFKYRYKNDLWYIDPETKTWAITYYEPTKYLWYNYQFFTEKMRLISMELPKDSTHIKNWVELKFGVEVGENVWPDLLPGDYDWKADFKVEDVLSDSETCLVD